MLIFNFGCNPLLSIHLELNFYYLDIQALFGYKAKISFVRERRLKKEKGPIQGLPWWSSVRLCAPDAGDLGSIPGEGTGSYRPP